ncbi:alpha/beta fold hydrolase [Dyella lutea]|uniref:Alpha/beta hydrolase n=1 Tax=Dyella lutea TaxID=2950441 RepID=A0ABT1FCS2_9GAMM|nr:alpha/beta hydrolase [Dyella lutea]MCP1375180.1 alpha/beta hydrolase [Dyella lutea]
MTLPSYATGQLPDRIRSRLIPRVNGLDMHILEAGHERPGRPLLVLLHGFPDLAYGWRFLLPVLAASGYHVVAPDLRGYGRTTGWQDAYDTPLAPFSLLNMARDTLALVSALGYRQAATVIGHDIGSPVSAYCALARPDVFRSVVFLSAPFPGPPTFPFDTAQLDMSSVIPGAGTNNLAAALSALRPPRKHYQHYLSSRQANVDMSHPPQGLHAFLRAFYHVKSGDWPGNDPHVLPGSSAEDFARMPTYYVMDLEKTMPETVAPFHPSVVEVQACAWLTEADLGIYVEEFRRTGFQGALQAYRVLSDPALNDELRLFSGGTVDVPSLFIGGEKDWGTYATPAALELMKTKATTCLQGVEMIDGVGHWIQQEQPIRLSELLLDFINDTGRTQ